MFGIESQGTPLGEGEVLEINLLMHVQLSTAPITATKGPRPEHHREPLTEEAKVSPSVNKTPQSQPPGQETAMVSLPVPGLCVPFQEMGLIP